MRRVEHRKFMEQAVAVMRASRAEARSDGKSSPKVGAVLLKADGSVQTAYRGELREGDHAEFTLLERKNRSENLEGSILFATLEPCAPGARKPPKCACAERIAFARIKEVWIGIEDPDPTVDRKGIKYLQDAGIKVFMFDRDLQEAIREENREFLKQAIERAASGDVELKPISLSPLENGFNGSRITDLSAEALEAFRSFARIEEKPQSPAFHRRLARLGLLKLNRAQPVPTGFGLILFGNEPRVVIPQAGLLGTIHYPNGREEIEDFDGPQVLVPGRAIEWLHNKLPNLIDRTAARRRFTDEPLFEMVREGVVNALVHRDYSIAGAKCHLMVTPEAIEVRSPGRPTEPLTVEQLQLFNAPMLSRNPILHYVFGRMELAEERGFGLRSMRRAAQDAGLPLPRYSWNDPYVVLTIHRSPESVTRTLPDEKLSALNRDERSAWEFAARTGSLTSPQLMRELSFDERKAQRVLKKLVELRLLKRVGKGPSTRYEIA